MYNNSFLPASIFCKMRHKNDKFSMQLPPHLVYPKKDDEMLRAKEKADYIMRKDKNLNGSAAGDIGRF